MLPGSAGLGGEGTGQDSSRGRDRGVPSLPVPYCTGDSTRAGATWKAAITKPRTPPSPREAQFLPEQPDASLACWGQAPGPMQRVTGSGRRTATLNWRPSWRNPVSCQLLEAHCPQQPRPPRRAQAPASSCEGQPVSLSEEPARRATPRAGTVGGSQTRGVEGDAEMREFHQNLPFPHALPRRSSWRLRPSPGAQQERRRRSLRHQTRRAGVGVFPGSRGETLDLAHTRRIPRTPSTGQVTAAKQNGSQRPARPVKPGTKTLGRGRQDREPNVRAGVDRVQQASPEGEQNRETRGRTEPR